MFNYVVVENKHTGFDAIKLLDEPFSGIIISYGKIEFEEDEENNEEEEQTDLSSNEKLEKLKILKSNLKEIIKPFKRINVEVDNDKILVNINTKEEYERRILNAEF